MVMDYSKGMKGTKVAYIMDTFPHAHYVDVLKKEKIDVLIHESSFLESEKERAWETRHSTAKMAGEIASKVGAKQLVLTHFSPRYPNGKDMQAEAASVFKSVTAAHDLMKVELPDKYAHATEKKERTKKSKK